MSDDKANPSLVNLMDEAAEALLRKVLETGNMTEQEAEFLAEKVRAFGAVSSWLLARIKAAPPKQGESKFSGVLKRLESKPERRAGGRRGNPGQAPPIDD